jgi:hypothetical protein
MSLSIQSPLDIIKLALKQVGVLGVGQTALDEDFNDAFMHLNMMISQWARKRWLVWHLVNYSKVSTGALSYTVGPGGDFDIPSRPDRLEAAFVRQLNPSSNQVDYPLRLIQSRETYNDISLKSLVSIPGGIFYDNAWPTGVVYAWPNPLPALYEIFISVKDPLLQFTSLAQKINIPPEYIPALMYNLAVRLGPAYQQPLDPVTVGLAKDALNVLRESNTQIAELNMPASLSHSGTYNPYSDQYR